MLCNKAFWTFAKASSYFRMLFRLILKTATSYHTKRHWLDHIWDYIVTFRGTVQLESTTSNFIPSTLIILICLFVMVGKSFKTKSRTGGSRVSNFYPLERIKTYQTPNKKNKFSGEKMCPFGENGPSWSHFRTLAKSSRRSARRSCGAVFGWHGSSVTSPSWRLEHVWMKSLTSKITILIMS